MSEQNEQNSGLENDFAYTLKDLLEQAMGDESWEPDEAKRRQFTAELERALNYL